MRTPKQFWTKSTNHDETLNLMRRILLPGLHLWVAIIFEDSGFYTTVIHCICHADVPSCHCCHWIPPLYAHAIVIIVTGSPLEARVLPSWLIRGWPRWIHAQCWLLAWTGEEIHILHSCSTGHAPPPSLTLSLSHATMPFLCSAAPLSLSTSLTQHTCKKMS
jgi:hypothetical protein